MTDKKELRDKNTKFLKNAGVEFKILNNGFHLQVVKDNVIYNFYPSTEVFNSTSGHDGKGLSKFIELVRTKEQFLSLVERDAIIAEHMRQWDQYVEDMSTYENNIK